MRRVVRLFARAAREGVRQLSRMALEPPTGVVTLVALVCTLAAVAGPRHATFASARVVRVKADTTAPQVVRLKADTTAAQAPSWMARLGRAR